MKIKKILIGIDDSEFSHHAAEYGFDIAHAYKASVGLVHITEPAILPSESTDSIMGAPFDINLENDMELHKIQSERATVLLEDIVKELGGNLEVTRFVQYGITVDGIIDCSKEFKADLIVVGTHRRTGLNRLFLGNIAGDVINKSEVPVIVVPFVENE